MAGRGGNPLPERPAGEEYSSAGISIDERGTIREGSRIDEHGTIREEPRGTSAATDHSCEHHSDPKARNLVVCIDGTANQFGLQVRTCLYRFYYSMLT